MFYDDDLDALFPVGGFGTRPAAGPRRMIGKTVGGIQRQPAVLPAGPPDEGLARAQQALLSQAAQQPAAATGHPLVDQMRAAALAPVGPPAPAFTTRLREGENYTDHVYDAGGAKVGVHRPGGYKEPKIGVEQKPGRQGALNQMSPEEMGRFLGFPTSNQWGWMPDASTQAKLAILKMANEQAGPRAHLLAAQEHAAAQKPDHNRLVEGLVFDRLSKGQAVTPQEIENWRRASELSSSRPAAAGQVDGPGTAGPVVPATLTPEELNATIGRFHAEGKELDAKKLGEELLANAMLSQNMPQLVSALSRRSIAGDPRSDIASEILRQMHYLGDIPSDLTEPIERRGVKLSRQSDQAGGGFVLETPKFRQQVPASLGNAWKQFTPTLGPVRFASTSSQYERTIPMLLQMMEAYRP